jgi:hypothetical protein
MTPIVRNIITNDLYKYEGGNKFTNLRSGVSGEVSDEAARKTFLINVEATIVINQNKVIEKLINILNLKIDKNE